MIILNELTRLLMQFNTQIFIIALLFSANSGLKKYGLIYLILGGLPFFFGPYIYNAVTGLSFYSSWFFKIGWYSTSYLLLCAYLFVLFYLSFKIGPKKILLILSASYLLQNILYNFSLLTRSAFPGIDAILFRSTHLLFTALLITLVYFFFRKKIKEFDVQKINNLVLLFFSVTLIVLLTIFSQWLSSAENNLNVKNIGNYFYAGTSSLLLLLLLLGIFNHGKLKQEKEIIDELIKKTEKQHRISKENIDLINIKAHDLKHQIKAFKLMLSNNEGKSLMQGTIDELEKTVAIYDNTIKTGNEIIDAILAEKKLYCDNNNIQLTYMIDGSKLNFIKAVDLYVIFGNALENAIECVSKIQNSDLRIISVIVNNHGKLINIEIENCYTEALDFENDVPRTNKKDKNYHGFGIKSIKYIVQKYHGNVVIFTDNNHFCLNILFPGETGNLPEKKAK